MNSIPVEAIQLILRALSLLVAREYKGLAQLSAGVRLSAEDFERAVMEYGRTLVMPVGDQFKLDSIRILTSEQPAWSVNVPLWSVEEGQSDLTLELTIYADPNNLIRIEFDNLHVN